MLLVAVCTFLYRNIMAFYPVGSNAQNVYAEVISGQFALINLLLSTMFPLIKLIYAHFHQLKQLVRCEKRGL